MPRPMVNASTVSGHGHVKRQSRQKSQPIDQISVHCHVFRFLPWKRSFTKANWMYLCTRIDAGVFVFDRSNMWENLVCSNNVRKFQPFAFVSSNGSPFWTRAIRIPPILQVKEQRNNFLCGFLFWCDRTRAYWAFGTANSSFYRR